MGELGLEKLQQPFHNNSARNACWYFLMHIEIIYKRTGITVVAFHPRVFKVSYFLEEQRCKNLLS